MTATTTGVTTPDSTLALATDPMTATGAGMAMATMAGLASTTVEGESSKALRRLRRGLMMAGRFVTGRRSCSVLSGSPLGGLSGAGSTTPTTPGTSTGTSSTTAPGGAIRTATS